MGAVGLIGEENLSGRNLAPHLVGVVIILHVIDARSKGLLFVHVF